MKDVYVLLLLSSFASTIFLVFAHTMIFYDGYASLNTYGEGWFETVLAGIFALIGYRQMAVNAND